MMVNFFIFLFYSIFFATLQNVSAEPNWHTVAKIEKIIQQDPGNRGVGHFYTKALLDATRSLEKATHVAILTGFFIPTAEQPETDGPLGSMFLAEALMAIGKKVTIVTDVFCLPAIRACYEVIQNKIDSNVFAIAVFPNAEQEQQSFVVELCSQVDCLVSIERVGRSVDGSYRTCRGLDITQKTAPLDDLFIYAQNHPEKPIKTIAIGDGGNEIGMGNVWNHVREHVPQGELIACVIFSDHLIVTGVSNWGGYALAGALYSLMEKEDKVSLDLVYATNEEQFEMLENMIRVGCCDGILGQPVLYVDGLSWNVHKKILDDIREIVKNHQK